jgi:hypothetical protein
MGNSTAKAKEAADDERKRVDALIQTLENKLEAIKLEIRSTRGAAAEGREKEVAGGRSVLRVSEVRVTDSSGVDENLEKGIENFFDAATNGIDGEEDKAKKSAVAGAKNLITAGLGALFGVTSGQGMTRQSFVVLFLNNAFVRVDYYAYSYSVSAEIWGAESNQSGVCYIADLAVLDTGELMPNEIDFLLSQALSVNNAEFQQLNKIKVALVQSAILSRALKNKDLDFEELSTIATGLAKSQEAISDAFNSLQDYVSVAERKRLAIELDEKENARPDLKERLKTVILSDTTDVSIQK